MQPRHWRLRLRAEITLSSFSFFVMVTIRISSVGVRSTKPCGVERGPFSICSWNGERIRNESQLAIYWTPIIRN